MNPEPLYPDNPVETDPDRLDRVKFLHSAHGADYYLMDGVFIEVIFGPNYQDWTYSYVDEAFIQNHPAGFSEEQRQHLDALVALYR